MLEYKIKDDESIEVRDPIYGKIRIPYPYSKIVMTKEMMRLEEYTQTGFSFEEYPGLKDEDRLGHSIGAFHNMVKIIKKIKKILEPYKISISQDDIDIACCSMVIHDIGHGPYSHSIEKSLKYSHEKRTADIILAHINDPYGENDTEISKVLVELYGEEKVKKIASFIAETNEQEMQKKDSLFTKLLKNLVSHQLDADRLDYLIRDSYYAKIPQSFSQEKVIENLNVSVNNSQEYELYVQSSGLSSVENVFIKRYQMYRDVYQSAISILKDVIFDEIFKIYKEKNLHLFPKENSFQMIVDATNGLPLNKFLKLSQHEIDNAIIQLKSLQVDPLLTYLCEEDNIKDFVLIQNHKSVEEIKKKIGEVYNVTLKEDTLSVMQASTKIVLYKKDQSLKVEHHNRISDITESTNLIRPQEVLELTYTFINPKILQIELGLTDSEVQEKESEWKNMMNELNKKPVEFELKYIVDTTLTDEELQKKIEELFLSNGYKMISSAEKNNSDEYYDTVNFELFQKGASCRIRKATSKGKVKYKGTYKIPSGESSVYSSRDEFEYPLDENTLTDFEKKIEEEADLNFDTIVKTPTLNSTTNRNDIVFEKNGDQVCVSLDTTVYTNHYLYETMAKDKMIEIEAMGDIKNRIMLNEIHDFIPKNVEGLTINKQSKYERGIRKTTAIYLEDIKGVQKVEENSLIRLLINETYGKRTF